MTEKVVEYLLPFNLPEGDFASQTRSWGAENMRVAIARR